MFNKLKWAEISWEVFSWENRVVRGQAIPAGECVCDEFTACSSLALPSYKNIDKWWAAGAASLVRSLDVV